jgi:hypothetical protein
MLCMSRSWASIGQTSFRTRSLMVKQLSTCSSVFTLIEHRDHCLPQATVFREASADWWDRLPQ